VNEREGRGDAGSAVPAPTPTPEYISVWLSRSVEELDVDVRAANVLHRAGIKTIGELALRGDLRRERNCGPMTVRRLHDAVSALGIKPAWSRP
jgi:DNA-directed RNA polymerase alpha subunit